MIAKVADIQPLIARGRIDPPSVFAELRRLAASDEWQTREVAATALVEIGRRHPTAVAREAQVWAKDANPRIRRAASEGLRGIVKQSPELVWPVLEHLCADPDLYVKKSVANVLRNASGHYPSEVLALCSTWVQAADVNTLWIVKDALRKLRATHPADVERILTSARSAV